MDIFKELLVKYANSQLKKEFERKEIEYISKIKKLESQLTTYQSDNPNIRKTTTNTSGKNISKEQKETFDNDYALKNFYVCYLGHGASLTINGKESIHYCVELTIGCDKNFYFKGNFGRRNFEITNMDKYVTNNQTPVFKFYFYIYADGIKDVLFSMSRKVYEGDSYYDKSFGKFKTAVEEEFSMPDETRKFLLAIIDEFDFENGIDFARRFVANPEEFERMLKHINHPEANIKPNNNQVNVTSQTSTNKALLEAKKNELLSANASRNNTPSDNLSDSPLDRYIANQAKQKRK